MCESKNKKNPLTYGDQMKTCSKCNQDKPLIEFYTTSITEDGLQYLCKSCVADYYQTNKTRICKRMREYRKTRVGIVETRKRYMGTERGKELSRLASKKYRLKHPDRCEARKIVRRAIDSGELVRPTICPSCDTETFIESHHPDYSKPLEIEWLCNKCHNIIGELT